MFNQQEVAKHLSAQALLNHTVGCILSKSHLAPIS